MSAELLANRSTMLTVAQDLGRLARQRGAKISDCVFTDEELVANWRYGYCAGCDRKGECCQRQTDVCRVDGATRESRRQSLLTATD